jgi:hypothetical protein
MMSSIKWFMLGATGALLFVLAVESSRSAHSWIELDKIMENQDD